MFRSWITVSMLVPRSTFTFSCSFAVAWLFLVLVLMRSVERCTGAMSGLLVTPRGVAQPVKKPITKMVAISFKMVLVNRVKDNRRQHKTQEPEK